MCKMPKLFSSSTYYPKVLLLHMRELVWVGGKMHVSWETTLHYLFERKASSSLLPHRTKSCLSSWLIYDRLWQKQKFWQAEKRSRSKWVNNNPQSIDWFWGLQVPTQSIIQRQSLYAISPDPDWMQKKRIQIPVHVKSKTSLHLTHKVACTVENSWRCL